MSVPSVNEAPWRRPTIDDKIDVGRYLAEWEGYLRSGEFPLDYGRDYVLTALMRWTDDSMLSLDCREKAARLVREFSSN